MSSLAPGGKHSWVPLLGVLLTAVSMFAFVVRYIVKLDEANDTKTTIIARLESAVEDLKRERNEMSKSLVRIEENVADLREDMRDVKGDVKEINGKVSRRGR